MVRKGHVVSVSAYLRVDDVEGEGEAATGSCFAVILSGAVASDSMVCVSFAAWSAADVGMLHERSKKSVHLRSGTPIVGIA